MIKFMVDSAADCRPDKYDFFVPLMVNIGGREYKSGMDIDSDTFYELLTGGSEFPQTSQPSPETFIEIFEKIKESGDTLIYFAISSALSGTYQGACIAKEMVGYDDIYIIDTKTASHMIGLLADYTKGLTDSGVSAREAVEKCEELKRRIKAFAGVDTLEYLRRGGRLGNASAVVGKLANIKPIVTVTDEGGVDAIGKTIGVGKAIRFITDKVSSFEVDTDFPVYSLYTKGIENCEMLERALSEEGIKIEKRLQVGSVIGAHVGPGVYGVFFVAK